MLAPGVVTICAHLLSEETARSFSSTDRSIAVDTGDAVVSTGKGNTMRTMNTINTRNTMDTMDTIGTMDARLAPPKPGPGGARALKKENKL